jgi:hypothetical protein
MAAGGKIDRSWASRRRRKQLALLLQFLDLCGRDDRDVGGLALEKAFSAGAERGVFNLRRISDLFL